MSYYETFTESEDTNAKDTEDNAVMVSDMVADVGRVIDLLDQKLSKADPVGTAIQTEQIVASQNEIAYRQHRDAAEGAQQAAKQYERASQLKASGEHIAQMQDRILAKNRGVLGGMNADIMTAKRVATINQQNTIHANNVTDYMRVSIIFLCVAIVLMFLFGIGMTLMKRVMDHPLILLQLLLVLLGVIYVIVMLYKVLTNTNHYRMLYQEREFPFYKPDGDVEEEDCECPDAVTPTDTEPVDRCASPDKANNAAITDAVAEVAEAAAAAATGPKCGANN